MKAMVLEETMGIESNPLHFEDMEKPMPDKHQILIKIISCGVCGSELQMIEGRWKRFGSPPKLPLIPGHEIIGRVFAYGESVQGFRTGDLVGMQYLWNSCGKCNFCLNGNENLCSSASVTGETVDGGYAEYIVGNEKHVYRMPSGIDPLRDSPMMGAGITAYRAVKKTMPLDGKTIAIVGAGGIGKMAIQFSKLLGAKVIAVSRNEANRDISLRLGADEAFDPGPDYTEATRIRRTADSVIVFAPSDKAVEAALKICKKTGKVILGVYATVTDFRFTDEIEVSGTLIANIAETNESLKLMAEHKIALDTRVFPLKSANDVLSMLKNSEIHGRAVLQI